ncbi:HD domain-containing protein [soil metagenome]
MSAWWTGRVRQFWRHVSGRVSAAERHDLEAWLTPAQLELFDGMHPADRRHGLDVLASLRRAGHSQADLLLAGLLHDCAKGSAVGLWHRVGWSLAEHYGARTRALIVRLPGFGAAFQVIADHPRRSAEMVLGAGCSQRTADLILHQDQPKQTELDRALRLADQAN